MLAVKFSNFTAHNILTIRVYLYIFFITNAKNTEKSDLFT